MLTPKMNSGSEKTIIRNLNQMYDSSPQYSDN